MTKTEIKQNPAPPRIYLTDDTHMRTGSFWNGMGGDEYRRFCIIIDKRTGTCTLFIENIRGEVLNQQAFHVSPFRGSWIKGSTTSPFIANDDASTIEPRMAYSFKPLLLKMGLALVPDTIFHEVRKNLNQPYNLLKNLKQN